jgi:hypothetical protein
MVSVIIEPPLVANFVKTDKGMFRLADLSEKEYQHYKALLICELDKNRDRQKRLIKENTNLGMICKK